MGRISRALEGPRPVKKKIKETSVITQHVNHKAPATEAQLAKSSRSLKPKTMPSVSFKEQLVVKDKSPPFTFQTLPLDIRYIIYSQLLPWRKRLIYLTGKDDRVPTFGFLSQTCKQIQAELTQWFKDNENLQRRFSITVQYGIIRHDTHFALKINDEFRDLEACEVDEATAAGSQALIPECTCCTKFKRLLSPPDFRLIRSLVLHFSTEDQPGRRDNLNSIKRLPHIPNLKELDFLLGDNGNIWDFWKEDWNWETKEESKVWVPTSGTLMAIVNARLAFPERIVIHVWLVVWGEEKLKAEVLWSWQERAKVRRYSVVDSSSEMKVD